MTKIFSFPGYLMKFYLVKTEIVRLLMLSVFFSTLLLAARVFYTGSLTFVSLEWNLFLAFVPYCISRWMYNTPAFFVNKWKFAVGFFLWLIFIPNSFYIVTDLFHLTESNNAPLWFNVLLIFSFAWNGLLFGILSLRQMEKITRFVLGGLNEFLFLCPVMWLNALGVFIGRYYRFNSWDIITNPFRLMMDIINLLAHPLSFKNAWGMICCYAVFMTLFYLTMKKISKIIW